MKSPDGRECSAFLRHKKLALTGKRTTALYFLNPNQHSVEKVQVDGCAITDGARCDWLVILNDPFPQEELYVELKGSHLDRAAEQLEATIRGLSSDARRFRKRCFVVFNRNPMAGTDVQKYKLKFSRKFNAVLSLVRDKTEVLL